MAIELPVGNLVETARSVLRALDRIIVNGSSADEIRGIRDGLAAAVRDHAGPHAKDPISMRLTCPACSALHIDEGEFATKAHHTHACQSCGNVWRPAIVPTLGVRFLPGFKNP